MELKEGFKKTDWGEIPIDWDVVTLADLTEKNRPISYGIVQTGENVLNGVKCVRVVDIIDGFVDSSNLITTSKEISDSYKRTILKEGDLVIALRGKVGEIAYIDQSLEGSNLTRGVAVIGTNKNFDSRFVKQQLNSKHQKHIFENNLNGSALKELALSVLRKIPIAAPIDLTEQTAIATALSDTDALITSIEKLIAKKRMIKQGAMQKLLTPKEDWEVKKLGDILDYEQPTNYLVKDDKYIETSNIPVLTAGKTFILGYTSENDGIYTNLPVIIFDDFTTASKFVNFPFKAKSSAMKMLIPKDKNVNLRFMFEIMQKINYPVADHQRHWIGVFHKMEISVPNPDEQNRIATILSDMDSEIEAIETKLAKYKQIKHGMMQQLLTGKIRLGNVVEEKEEKAKLTQLHETKITTKGHSDSFHDAVLIGTMAYVFGSERFPLTRFMYSKVSYLLKRYKQEQDKEYYKKAAGPYKHKTRYGGAEAIAIKNKYIKVFVTNSKGKKYENFLADENYQEAIDYFIKWYGEEALQWIQQFKFEKRDKLELWATVDMAVQDLKEENKEATLHSVKELIKNNKEWKDKLKRPIFSDINIQSAIKKSDSLFNHN